MSVNFQTPSSPNTEHGTTLNKRVRVDESNLLDDRFPALMKPIIVEMIGTMLFMVIGLLSICNDKSLGNVFIGPIGFGFSLAMFSASLGHISGTHFNPAVTIGMLAAGVMRIRKAVAYIFMQIVGSMIAAGIFRLLSSSTNYKQCRGGVTTLTVFTKSIDSNTIVVDATQWWEGMIVECLLTFTFVLVILFVNIDSKSKSNIAPIYIGLSLSVCILAGNSMTGGSLNPARSFGPAILANIWTHHYIYWVGPIAGAILAGGIYRFIWHTTQQA